MKIIHPAASEVLSPGDDRPRFLERVVYHYQLLGEEPPSLMGFVVSMEHFHPDRMTTAPHWYESKKAERFWFQLEQSGAKVALVDGNHRTTAGLIRRLPLCLMELEDDEDVDFATTLYRRRMIPSFPHLDYTLREVVSRIAHGIQKSEFVETLDERFGYLTSKGYLDEFHKLLEET